MDPSLLVAPVESLPAAPWLFTALLVATFVAHLLFMNAMFGLVLIGAVRSLSPAAAPGLPEQAGQVPGLTALAVNLGVAPLLFVQAVYGQFMYAGSTLMGAYWFGIVLAVMLAYGLAYRQKYALARGQAAGAGLWLAMSLCLVYTSLMQTHNALLLLRPDLWPGYFQNPTGRLLPWGDPTLIPRWLHFVTASLAMGGLVLAMMGRGMTRGGDTQGAALTTRQGMAWFRSGPPWPRRPGSGSWSACPGT